MERIAQMNTQDENLGEVRRRMWLQDDGLKIQEVLHIFSPQSLPALKDTALRADGAGGTSMVVNGAQGSQV